MASAREGGRANRPRNEHGQDPALRSRHPDHLSHSASRPVSVDDARLLRLAIEDLKGPLAAIRLHLVHLDPDRGQDPERRRAAFRAIERNVARLDVLLDDAGDLSNLERGTLALEPADLDLRMVVRSLLAAFAPFLADAGLRVEADLEDAPRVHADEHRLTQAIASLLHAAIQSTPRGGTIRLRTAATATHACLEILDTGRGMTPEQIRNIGDLGALDRRPGLGLHFARIMVGLHSGTLTIESPGIGMGTQVRACFPVPAAKARAQATA